MINPIKTVVDYVKGKSPDLKARSSEWPKVRREHLKMFPKCAVCDGRSKVEVHHIVPFHVDRSLELNPSNLITLCESKKHGINCHLFVGHLGNYSKASRNPVILAKAMGGILRSEGANQIQSEIPVGLGSEVDPK